MLERLFHPESRSKLIEAAFNDVSEMLSQGAKMLDLSLAALLDNRSLEVDLDSLDDVVDEGERMVRRSVLQHLAVSPQQDLVASLVLVSMVQDAERIGDFARGLAELVPLARHRREGPFAERLRSVADRLRLLFGRCEEAFREDDTEKAQEVIGTTRALKKELIAYTRDVAESELSADMAVVYASAARILRRIGSHLSNISSSVTQPYDRIRHGDEEA
jgi:phosphate uptake regulator